MDYNEDGKVDFGEQFIDYQIYQDVTGSNQTSNQFHIPRGKRFDVFDIMIRASKGTIPKTKIYGEVKNQKESAH